ncbi:hypothetical protein EV197_1436 [Aquimarina brevivitae]|uniref:Lacal_2735 family protein n=2 Tax=Aquimarina brevivitae TaxID=323412 RepID=A0A4V2F7L1_9FLAO|nr:hypothetical protein EV197_1436 [Aquimarina brevivitae]
MFDWIQNKTELQLLKEKYCKLMKKSYQLALSDKKKSDALNLEAKQLLSKIKDYEAEKEIAS